MTREPVETRNLAGLYNLPPVPWSRARDRLVTDSPSPATPFFLGTVGPDGRPHSAGIGALWHDDCLYFVSGPHLRKTRDVLANPACTISGRLTDIDLVMEGEAARVTDPATLEELAQRYRDSGWPAEVAGDAFTAPYSAPSAGSPPWHVFRFRFHTATGLTLTEPGGATRWTF